MPDLSAKEVNYFGYGAMASIEMIEALIGRKPKGSDFYLNDYELCIQEWGQIPPEIRRVLSKEWGSSFRTYCIRPAQGKMAFGKLWVITSKERQIIQAWEFWYEPIKVQVKTRSGKIIEVETEIMRDPHLEVVINGENYDPLLNDEKRMIRLAKTFNETQLTIDR